MIQKRNIKKLCYCILCLLSFVACQSEPDAVTQPTLQITPIIQVINYPKPKWSVDIQPFDVGGCPPDPNEGNRVCQSGTPLADLGCDEVAEPSSLSGALKPSYPIIDCLIRPSRHTNPEQFINKLKGEGWIYRVGCSEPVYIRYVIFRNNKFQLIKTISEFQSIFAPIESTAPVVSGGPKTLTSN